MSDCVAPIRLPLGLSRQSLEEAFSEVWPGLHRRLLGRWLLANVVALYNMVGLRSLVPYWEKGDEAYMERILALLTVALIMAAMMAASAMPTFAVEPQNGNALHACNSHTGSHPPFCM